MFKDLFACKRVLAANHQYPGNIQRLCGQQKQILAATIDSNQQQQPAIIQQAVFQQQAAIIQQAVFQTQPAVIHQPAPAINSSNQQQQPTAAINSSNQQQQSTTTTSSNNQLSSYQQHLHDQRRHLLVITTVPSRGYPAIS